eukprot:1049-Eustigmatos_ZCMA.PRE.1
MLSARATASKCWSLTAHQSTERFTMAKCSAGGPLRVSAVLYKGVTASGQHADRDTPIAFLSFL